MPTLEINHLESGDELAKGLMDQLNQLTESVRHRAYELFEQRGGTHGTDLEDWLRAEQELLFPAGFEVIRESGSYKLCASLPRLAAQDLKIYTLLNSLILIGNGDAGPSAAQPGRLPPFFYWWPLALGTQIEGIYAELKHNRLEITIPVKIKAEAGLAVIADHGMETQKSAAA